MHVDDVIFAQYREVGVIHHRGFTLQDIVNQCFSNAKDLGKGRQMPVHYGHALLLPPLSLLTQTDRRRPTSRPSRHRWALRFLKPRAPPTP